MRTIVPSETPGLYLCAATIPEWKEAIPLLHNLGAILSEREVYKDLINRIMSRPFDLDIVTLGLAPTSPVPIEVDETDMQRIRRVFSFCLYNNYAESLKAIGLDAETQEYAQ